MRTINYLFSLGLTFLALGLSAQPGSVMPSVPGKCYAKCLIQDQYETVTEQIMTKGASKRAEISGAKFETVTEKALKREAGGTVSINGAKFEKMTQQVVSKEGGSTLTVVPAKFTTESKQMISKDASTSLSVVAP